MKFQKSKNHILFQKIFLNVHQKLHATILLHYIQLEIILIAQNDQISNHQKVSTRLYPSKNLPKYILAPKISISPKSMGNETSSSVGFGSLHGGRETPSSIVSDTEQIFQLQVT